jgi:hypothetical protein
MSVAFMAVTKTFADGTVANGRARPGVRALSWFNRAARPLRLRKTTACASRRVFEFQRPAISRWAGKDINRICRRVKLRNIGMEFSELSPTHHKTVYENIAIPCASAGSAWTRTTAQ